MLKRHQYGVDFLGTISEKLISLSGFTVIVKELVQNADDEEAEWITFDFHNSGLYVANASIFSEPDFERIKLIAARGKKSEPHKTGAFGIGFVSVYQVSDHPELQSADKKYVFLPDEQAVDEDTSNITDHTEFFLPWAFDPDSPTRRALKKEAVNADDLPKFISELKRAAPGILLFLRSLRRIRILKDGIAEVEFVRTDENPLRKVDWVADGKPAIRKWLTYETTFDAPEAEQLYKEPIVGLAFPVSEDNAGEDGMLYNFLPTGMYTEYKFHINGDFFPTSDRKSIVTEGIGYEARWNSKVMEAIGQLLINSIPDLKRRLSIETLYELFPPHDFDSKNLPLLNVIRKAFYEYSAEADIVPDSRLKWHKPAKIFLLEAKDEGIRQTLESIGIPLVHPDLRRFWPLIQTGLRTNALDLETLIEFIRRIGIPSGTFQGDAPPPFNSMQGISNILSFVQDRLKTKSEEKFLNDFSQLPICPNCTGQLHPFRELRLFSPHVEKIFTNLSGLPLVDASLQTQCRETLKRIMPEYDWHCVIDFFCEKTGGEIAAMEEKHAIDLLALYDYLADNGEQILNDKKYQAKLNKTSIFLAHDQLRPLSELCLPGNYQDPIGLDIIIPEDILAGKVRDFLKKLGVKPLDFVTYVKKHVPRYFRNKELRQMEDKRLELAEEIRKNFSSIDGADIRSLLRTIPIVPCNDNNFHIPDQVYLKSEPLDIVLGQHYLYPDEQRIGKNIESWIDWLKLLGVTDKPKPADVIQRIRELAAKWSQENVQAVEQLFYYLCDAFEQQDFRDQAPYESLKYIEWLPAEDCQQYHLPSKVYLPHNKHLFSSQGIFVPFRQRARMRGKFLDFIKIGNFPSPELIVKHLLWLSQEGLGPPEYDVYEVYRVLNQQAGKLPEGTMRFLCDRNCVYVEGIGYCNATRIFWNTHPFGSYRQKASDQLRNYYDVLKRIGVREEPELKDYVDVLLDISEKFGTSNKPLDEETQAIVKNIYAFLSLHESEPPDDSIAKLSQQKVVLDRSKLLRIPNQIFFEDKGIAADIFRDRLRGELIDKEPNTWRFLERLGVRHLSRAIQPIDFAPPQDKKPCLEDMNSIKSRKRAIITIVETQRKDFDSGWDVGFLDYLEIYETAHLILKYEVKINSSSIPSDEHDERSFYDKGTHHLYISRNCIGTDRTYEIARNIAAILNPEIDPCHVLPVLVEVLAPSREPKTIGNYLSQMGYDVIVEGDIPPLTPVTTRAECIGERAEVSGGTKDLKSSVESSQQNQAESTRKREEEYPRSAAQIQRQKETEVFGSGSATGTELEEKRKRCFTERLKHETTSLEHQDSEYNPPTHTMTPEELENHKHFAVIFYNRQIEKLMSCVQELELGEGPTQYSIYGPEWEEISKLVRERDRNRCRRCGLSEEDGVSLVVHHIWPRNRGGSNWHSNLITLCRTCHAEVEYRPWLL